MQNIIAKSNHVAIHTLFLARSNLCAPIFCPIKVAAAPPRAKAGISILSCNLITIPNVATAFMPNTATKDITAIYIVVRKNIFRDEGIPILNISLMMSNRTRGPWLIIDTFAFPLFNNLNTITIRYLPYQFLQ